MRPFRVRQNTTFKYTVTFKDETGAAIANSAIDAITMTYWERKSGTIINSRSAQDVHAANNCTYGTADGLFTWNGQQADTVLVSENANVEEHDVMIQVQYSTTKYATHLFSFAVENVRKVGNP